MAISEKYISEKPRVNVLTIAGSDTSAGAGIQQDLKTVTSLGQYCCTVITALTCQNTQRIINVMPTPAEIVRDQIRAVFDDIYIHAIKIGMIPNMQVAITIHDELKKHLANHPTPIVLDPIMVSTSGRQLMDDDCISFVRDNIFPLCTLVTPNIPEYQQLQKMPPSDVDPFRHTALLLKGGHGEGTEMIDNLIMPDGTQHSFTSPKIESTNLHGTGCTLSSAIATFLALGDSLPEAVEHGKQIINKGIEGGRNLAIGNGNGPLWLF